MNTKGFTLIELIVAIAIMGVLLIIALPQVAKIQSNNKERKYEAYQQSMERAAKLYTDSNEKDLFGYYTSGCSKVTFDDLKKANLLKDIQIKDINCDNSYTYVNVTKANNEYHYTSNLVCKDKSGMIVYGTEQSIGCVTEEDNDAPQIYITPDLDWKNIKDVNNITIKVSDDQDLKPGLGLNKNISVKYQWVKQGSTISNNNWKTINFENSKYQHTVKKVLKTKQLPTESGIYTLYVIPVSVMDVVGKSTTTRVSHEYKFDNTNPTASLSKSGATISISASDSHSGLKSYYFGTKTCNSLSNTDYISATSLNKSVTKYDGKTYYLCVKDKVGNTNNKSIEAYKYCHETEFTGAKFSKSGSRCSVSCGGGTQTAQQNTVDKYDKSYSCGAKDNGTISCNTQPCCTPTTTYEWGKCDKNCGSTGKKYKYKVVNNCDGTQTKTKTEDYVSCPNTDCYSITDSSYHVCPSDQKEHTTDECNKSPYDGKTYGWQAFDGLSVSLSRTSGKQHQYIHITATVHMNKYSVTYDGKCGGRKICIAKKDSSSCIMQLGTFSINKNNWLSKDGTKTVVDDDFKISTLAKGKYRIIISRTTTSCSSTKFRFSTENNIVAFNVTQNP